MQGGKSEIWFALFFKMCYTIRKIILGEQHMNNLQAAQMEALVDSLLDSYREYSVISNIDSDNRLNREMIIKICDMVRQIPGIF